MPPGNAVTPVPKKFDQLVVPSIAALSKLAPSASVPRHSSDPRAALRITSKAEIDAADAVAAASATSDSQTAYRCRGAVPAPMLHCR